jgi:hypothetical protein
MMKNILNFIFLICLTIGINGQKANVSYSEILKLLHFDCSRPDSIWFNYCNGNGLSIKPIGKSTKQYNYFWVEDMGTAFSGAHTKQKWIFLQDRIVNAYSIIQSLPYEVKFLKKKTNGFNDILIYYNYYSELSSPSRELRTGILKWQNNMYVFDKIKSINNKPFKIPREILDQVGYCAQEDPELLGRDTLKILCDTVGLRNMHVIYQKIAPAKDGLILYQYNQFNQFDTWIFEKQNDKYVLCQKFNKQKVVISKIITNDYYEIQMVDATWETALPRYYRSAGKYILKQNNNSL